MRLYGSGFELHGEDPESIVGETVVLCSHPECVKTATEWNGAKGYCEQHFGLSSNKKGEPEA